MMDSNIGRLVAYVGAMGSGKTKKLIELYEEMLAEGLRVKVFKPSTSREGEEDEFVYARNGKKAPATVIDYLDEIPFIAEEEQLQAILIDEIQFFEDDESEKLLEGMAMAGLEVYVFGLDVDSDNNTFGNIGNILAHADEVYKLHTSCVKCGEEARISKYMKGEKDSVIQPGDLDDYLPHCRACYYGWADKLKKTQDIVGITLSGEGFYFACNLNRGQIEQAGYSLEDIKNMKNITDILRLIETIQNTAKGDT